MSLWTIRTGDPSAQKSNPATAGLLEKPQLHYIRDRRINGRDRQNGGGHDRYHPRVF